jgi:hypothetical protein
MGVAIPQIITEDRASGALVVDGSLRFDSSKSHYLSRTPGSAGSRTTWTWSGWIKRSKLGGTQRFFDGANATADNDWTSLLFNTSDNLVIGAYSVFLRTSNSVYRDINAWMHIVIAADLNNASNSLKYRAWVNNQEITWTSTSTNQTTSGINAANNHSIGAEQSPNNGGVGGYTDIQVTNLYFIDGQALDASYFGYTDALTNTWRPKKLSSSVAFGTNGFYLPFDGSAPIGQDQSGRGNNWTPVNFGGSNTLEKATGALPILNTDGGGKVARVGVRTDSNASSLVLALPLVGIKSDFSNAVNSGTSNKAITANGNAAASSAQSNFYGGSFAFDGTGDTLSIASGSDFQIWSGAFTVECWFYLNSLVDNRGIFGVGNRASTTTRCFLMTRSSGNLQFDWDGWSADGSLSVSAGLSAGRWYHCAVVSNGSTVSIYVNGISLGSASIGSSSQANAPLSIGAFGAASNPTTNDGINGYIQDFRIYKGVAKYTQNFIPASTDPDILPDTPSGVAYSSNVALVPSTDGAVAFDGADGTALQLSNHSDIQLGSGTNWTIEFFAYRNGAFVDFDVIAGKGAAGTYEWFIEGFADGSVDILYSANGSTTWTGQHEILSNMALNRWYHIALVRNGSGANNFKAYVDGVQTFQTTAFDIYAGTGVLHIGGYNGAAGQDPPIIISNFRIVNGSSVYTSNFTPPSAPLTAVQNTKLLCCKSQTSATAADVTPGTITANGNAAATNFNPFTVNINTQRGQESGYATLNPLSSASNFTISNGNLKSVDASSTAQSRQYANISISSGKYYFETTIETASNTTMTGFAVNTGLTNSYPGSLSTDWTYHSSGFLYNNGSTTSTTAATSAGDVIGNAIDMDTGKIWFSVNGNFVGGGVPSTGTNASFSSVTGTITPVFRPYASTISVNFGQKPFKFPPPAGFQPLALANTPRPTIVRPDQYVGVTTYIGTSGATSVSNLQFKPDLVWLKNRDSGDGWHQWRDSVRGGDKNLASNSGIAESDASTKNLIFNSNGFTLTGTTDSRDDNYDGDDYVAWCWKAGGNSNTFNIDDVGYDTASAAGLSGGDLTITGASVGTKQGFSIIEYVGNNSTGQTVKHGLTQEPDFIIVKNKLQSYEWMIYHRSMGANYYGLFATSAFLNDANIWADTEPTNEHFYVSVHNSPAGYSNGPNGTFISYVWHDVPGFSKFGSYAGNNSSDGPVIITGFRPRLILIKCSSSNQSGNAHWLLFDGERNKFNVSSNIILGNVSEREYTAADGVVGIDILSNGFKIRDTNTSRNASATYIYAAFAESPTFNLYGAQSNAR